MANILPRRFFTQSFVWNCKAGEKLLTCDRRLPFTSLSDAESRAGWTSTRNTIRFASLLLCPQLELFQAAEMNERPHDARCNVILHLHSHQHLQPPCTQPLHPPLALTLALAYLLKVVEITAISLHYHHTLFVTTASSTTPHLTPWNQSDA